MPCSHHKFAIVNVATALGSAAKWLVTKYGNARTIAANRLPSMLRTATLCVAGTLGLINPLAAQEYPEFVGVYVVVDGEFIQLPRPERTDRITVQEIRQIYFPLTRNYGRMFYEIEDASRLDAYSPLTLASAPAMSGEFQGIFVRSRSVPERIVLVSLANLREFITVDGTDADYLGLQASGQRGLYQDMPPLVVRSGCGFGTPAFNVRLVDNTAVSFVPKDELQLELSSTAGQCGISETIPAQGYLVEVNGATYVFRMGQ